MDLYAPDEMEPLRRAVYDRITGGPRSQRGSLTDDEGRLPGPFNHMLIDPLVGSAFEQLGTVLRFESPLTPRMRELVILETARSVRSDYEWQAHASAALAIGIAPADLEAIVEGEPAPSLSPEEEIVRSVARAVLVDRALPDELFATASAQLGVTVLYDAVMLAGFYLTVSLVLTTWAIPMPEGAEPVFER
jgi:4-carboxymuconolactone decarboxylase